MLRVIATATIQNLTFKMVGIVCALAASILIARNFGAHVLGQLSYVQAYAGVLGVILSLGFSVSLPRYWITSDTTTNSSLIVVSFFSVILSAGIASVFFSLYKAEDGVLILLLSFLVSLFSIQQAAVRLVGMYSAFSLLQNIPSIIWLLVVSTLLLFGQPFTISFYVWCYLIPVLIGLVCLSSSIELRLPPYRKSMRLIRDSSLFLPSALSAIVFTQSDIIVLSWYVSDDDVGYYSVASKVAVVCSFVLVASNNFLQGELVRVGRNWGGGHRELFQKINGYRTLVSLLLILLVLAFRHQILSLFGTSFEVAEQSLLILLVGVTISNVVGPVGMLSNTFGNRRAYNIAVLIFAACNVVLNIALVPLFGIEGGAIATATSIAGLNLVGLAVVRRSVLRGG